MIQEILTYIENKYAPLSILVYGSYANGTNNEHSDFDCMIIVNDKTFSHDTSCVNGVQIDLFVYTINEINNIDSYFDFIQVFDSRIIKDTDNMGKRLIEAVNSYILSNSIKTEDEKVDLISWMNKMLTRAERDDAEGLYRYHLALTESLEIYCNLRDLYYFGPKKCINLLLKQDKKAYEYLLKAMKTTNYGLLSDWISYVTNI